MVEVLEEAMVRALKRQKSSEAQSISKFSANKWSLLASTAGISMKVSQHLEVTGDINTEAPAFKWEGESEPQQAGRYAQATGLAWNELQMLRHVTTI